MSLVEKSKTVGGLPRFWRFLQKPLHEKFRSFYVRWVRRFPILPVPVWLSFGVWWLARNDTLGQTLSCDGFENAERLFVERFLERGMTVLDIGAHHGFYTLLAAKRVGPNGKVIAFEPSPRERSALRLHLILNLCRNVTVEGLALGDTDSTATLYVVEGIQTGCNSLRPPVAIGETSQVRVHVVRLDDWLRDSKIERVDFIKLDVEGGELAVLEGSEHLLIRQPRPVILAEVQDIRTRPWSYPAKRILEHLGGRNFKWFGLLEDGSIEELDLSADQFEGNFVACPEELISKLQAFKTKGQKLEHPCLPPLSR